MELNPDVCYSASIARDARFDGTFFVCVKTTGIYCRPICPARKPKRENCTYVRAASAAEEAGFRPCLRCRPETAPGTPAWNGTSTTVSRGLRLIREGALEEAGVRALADRLGVGDRQLRRLFMEHLGTTPKAIEMSLRLHLARQLILDAGLPITRAAYDAGFKSVRRFNDAFLKCFLKSPSEILKEAERGAAIDAGKSVRLSLAYRPPYDWDALLAFFATRAVEGVESCAGGAYMRTIRIGEVGGVLCARHDAHRHRIDLELSLPEPVPMVPVVDRIRRIFDLDASPLDIAESLAEDPALADIVGRRPGLRVPGAWDDFEVAVRAIVGQQITVAGARTILGRIVDKYGAESPVQAGSAAGVLRLFPTPGSLDELDAGAVGLTGARASHIRALAETVARDGSLVDAARSLDENLARLLALPGVGPWTAHYIAMRALKHPDAFPTGDAGLRSAARNLGIDDLQERAAAWRPWRAYAALYLWQTLSEVT